MPIPVSVMVSFFHLAMILILSAILIVSDSVGYEVGEEYLEVFFLYDDLE